MQSIEFDAALAMIDTAAWDRPALKLRVLLHVKTVSELGVDGAEIGVRTISSALGSSIRSVTVALDELLGEGVLVVVDGSAGSRAVRYAIEPRVERWRVPWSSKIGIETVRMRLDLLAGRLVEGVVEAKPAFARVTDRAQPWRTRVTARALDPAGARDGARAKRALAYTPGRAQTDSAERGAPIPRIEDLSVDGQSTLQNVCGAISAKVGLPVGRTYRERIALALTGVDPRPILEAVDAAVAIRTVGLFVDLVEQLAHDQTRRSTVPAAPSVPAWEADPDCATCHGSGWATADQPCGCRSRSAVAGACETVPTTSGGHL
jgi:hypothetical protein